MIYDLCDLFETKYFFLLFKDLPVLPKFSVVLVFAVFFLFITVFRIICKFDFSFSVQNSFAVKTQT